MPDNDSQKSVFLFHGEDTYSLNQKANFWRDEFIKKHGDTSLEVLDGKTLAPREFSTNLETLPFLSEKRLIIVKDFLSQKGVGTGIHYPVPIHLQGAYRALNKTTGSFPVSEKEILGKVVFIIPSGYIYNGKYIPVLYWLLGYTFGLLVHRIRVQKAGQV